MPERKLVTEALKRGIGAVTVEGVTQEMRDRPLIRSDAAGRKMATTKEMLALESKSDRLCPPGAGTIAGRWAIPSGHVLANGSTTDKRRPSAMCSARATA